MKRGSLRTSKDYKSGKFIIEGRDRKSNNEWRLCWDEEREKQGLPKELIFDLEYDACCYLQGFIDWRDEEILKERRANGGVLGTFNKNQHPIKQDLKKKKRNKQARKSRRRNKK